MGWLVLLTILLAAAARCDLRAHRIPNALAVATAVAGLAARGLVAGAPSAAIALLVAVVLAAALLLPWRLRLLGGGDLKLIAATATWFAPAQVPWFLARVAVAGGVLAGVMYLLDLAARGRALVAVRVTGLAPQRRLALPYGVAIAMGGVLTAWGGR